MKAPAGVAVLPATASAAPADDESRSLAAQFAGYAAVYFPHLELDRIGHYAVAKIKEAILAVTRP
jgi:hypothetical protein